MLKDRVVQAYVLAQESHKGQIRKYTGAEYFTHAKYVARILEDLTGDEDLIIAGLCHDLLEDTKVTYDQLLSKFGKRVADIVLAVTNDKDQIKALGKTEYLRQKLTNLNGDSLVVKLADRYHNVKYLDKDCKTTQHMSFVVKYYNETKELLVALEGPEDYHRVLLDGIKYQLTYLKIKHKW